MIFGSRYSLAKKNEKNIFLKRTIRVSILASDTKEMGINIIRKQKEIKDLGGRNTTWCYLIFRSLTEYFLNCINGSLLWYLYTIYYRIVYL